ncbi:MAG: acyl-CoA thioesterase [Bacteroidia bacterium]|nr:acyl-CoA thioesterase [Bacteroidia bacterium]
MDSARTFRHIWPLRVRSYHVDRQNVVHNLQYLYFFEEARVEYIRAVGLPMDEGTFLTHDKFFVVKNCCEYAAPAYFDEMLEILTRISFIGESSIGFEHIARKTDGTLCARGEHVFVHVDTESNTPSRVPEALRSLIAAYEGAIPRK